jgi:hypothetical protein
MAATPTVAQGASADAGIDNTAWIGGHKGHDRLHFFLARCDALGECRPHRSGIDAPDSQQDFFFPPTTGITPCRSE